MKKIFDERRNKFQNDKENQKQLRTELLIIEFHSNKSDDPKESGSFDDRKMEIKKYKKFK